MEGRVEGRREGGDREGGRKEAKYRNTESKIKENKSGTSPTTNFIEYLLVKVVGQINILCDTLQSMRVIKALVLGETLRTSN